MKSSIFNANISVLHQRTVCLKAMALGKLLDKVLAKRKSYSILGKLITNVSVLHMIRMPHKWGYCNTFVLTTHSGQ